MNPEEPIAWSRKDLEQDPHGAGDKPARVRSMFAAIAGAYDLNNRLHSGWQDQRWRRIAVRMAAPGPDEDVLDVACGTGDLAEWFARARPASVTGVDFTPEMLAIAGRKAERRRRGPGEPEPSWEVGDATALRFDDASFDVASIAFGIRNVDEPAKALAELRRVLRPGGRLVILEFARPRNPLVRLASDVWTKRIMPVTASLVARDRSGAYRYLPRSVETFLDPAALAAAAREAGFEIAAQRPLTLGICVATLARVPG